MRPVRELARQRYLKRSGVLIVPFFDA